MINLNSIVEHSIISNKNFVVKIEDQIYSKFSCIKKNDKWETKYGSFKFITNTDLEIGEVLNIYPNKNFVERFFRPKANANTILLTENCDQKCLMCSQPPKNKDYLNFELYEQACNLLPKGTIIGISGGEPTLFKKDLFRMIRNVIDERSDINFHILSNGQHFDNNDTKDLIEISKNVLWGVPIYSSSEVIHDHIVNKSGAFQTLFNNLDLLRKTGSRLEIRTVLMKNNVFDLENIALNINKDHSWLEVWAIMQLEKYGYAKLNWDNIFYDSSENFEPISKALLATRIYNINTRLYNFPFCTVPKFYRNIAIKSISDWKQKYLENCETCLEKRNCCGFFEWYDGSFKEINAIKI